MNNPALVIKNFKKEKDFLIAIDSDGSVFDTMEIKIKQCIIPHIINDWGLEPISKFASETAEFVNLYSVWRGANRFLALIKVFDLLVKREAVFKSGFKVPEVASLRKWIETETNLSNSALEKVVKETGNPILAQALRWSLNINDSIDKIVHGMPSFLLVQESLEKMIQLADIIVASTTAIESLTREWEEHDFTKYIKVIMGQEMGAKKEHLTLAKKHYADNHVLMIGDASGDMIAAKANNVLYYPINPGYENASWQRFYEEALDKFFNGQYAGFYETELVIQFEKFLPEIPPWIK